MIEEALPRVKQNLPIHLLRLLRYNKSRSDRALQLLPASQRPLYHSIPFLLHINHPAFVGYIDNPSVPHGLNNYSLRDEVPLALRRLFPQNTGLLTNMSSIWPDQRQIGSLLLMGSLGSIGQTDDSDFDYWVCIDGEAFSDEQKQLLQQKLCQIEEWAQSQHQLEVHFFLSEVEKVKNNDFGQAGGESSGSAQAVFLKAEFYTSHILLAGKAPFWWLVPDDTSDQQYQALYEMMLAGESPDPDWFMDLGNIEKLDPSELFGAAIWQISKAMDSPFKSLLKMAKLEVFLDNIEQQQPLCNRLKSQVHKAANLSCELEQIDPYALMFDKLVEFYTQQGQTDTVALLQTCLYIKCNCNLGTPPEKLNFKQAMMKRYVQQWNWDQDQLRRLDNIHYWDYAAIMQLSRNIHRFLLDCYRRISSRLDNQSQKVGATDMTLIGRKLAVFYARKQHKIDYLRSAFEAEVYCPMVILRPVNSKWYLLDSNQSGDEFNKKAALKSSNSPIELILWAVWNRVIDERSQLLLEDDESPIQEQDLYSLTRYFLQLFAPLRVSELSREALLAAATITHSLTLINFEVKRYHKEIRELQTLYLTSWGELYFQPDLPDLSLGRWQAYAVAPENSKRDVLYKKLQEQSKKRFTFL